MIVIAVHQCHVHALITQLVSARDTSQTAAQDQDIVSHRHSSETQVAAVSGLVTASRDLPSASAGRWTESGPLVRLS